MCFILLLYNLSLGEYILSKFEISILKSETRTKLPYTKYTLPLYTEVCMHAITLFLFIRFFFQHFSIILIFRFLKEGREVEAQSLHLIKNAHSITANRGSTATRSCKKSSHS